MSDVNFIMECLNKFKNRDVKSVYQIDKIIYSSDALKLIKKVKKEDIETYINYLTMQEDREKLLKVASVIQYKFTNQLDKIIKYFISKEDIYYLIRMIKEIKKVNIEQVSIIIKRILTLPYDSMENLAETVCYIANNFLDVSNKIRPTEERYDLVSILILEIYNKDNYKEIIEAVKTAIEKKRENSRKTKSCYLPFGYAITTELDLFDRALRKYNLQKEKEINQ